MMNQSDLAEREKELDCLYAIADMLTGSVSEPCQLIAGCAEELVKAMSYPKSACIKIKAGEESHGSEIPLKNPSLFRASSQPDSRDMVEIHIWYESNHEFVEREKKLVISVASLLSNALSKNSYFREIEEKTAELESKNTALREVLHQIDKDRKDFINSARKAAGTSILPVICELEDTPLTERQGGLVRQLKSRLEKILESPENSLAGISGIVTPRELEICHLIRNGEASKDIAALLNISLQTVERHRNTIRNKLGINRKGINLVLYLRNM